MATAMRKIGCIDKRPISLVLLEERIARAQGLSIWNCSCGTQILTVYYALYHINKFHPGDSFEKRISLTKTVELDISKWIHLYDDLSNNIFEAIGSKSQDCEPVTINLEPSGSTNNDEITVDEGEISAHEKTEVSIIDVVQSKISELKEREKHETPQDKAAEILEKFKPLLDKYIPKDGSSRRSSISTYGYGADATVIDMDISESESSPHMRECPASPALPNTSNYETQTSLINQDDPMGPQEIDPTLKKPLLSDQPTTLVTPKILLEDATNFFEKPEDLTNITSDNEHTNKALNIETTVDERLQRTKMVETKRKQEHQIDPNSWKISQSQDDKSSQEILQRTESPTNTAKSESSIHDSAVFTKPFSFVITDKKLTPMNKLLDDEMDEFLDNSVVDSNDGDDKVMDEQMSNLESDVNLQISPPPEEPTESHPSDSRTTENFPSCSKLFNESFTLHSIPVLNGVPNLYPRLPYSQKQQPTPFFNRK